MPEFCTCGAQLPPDALFCHKCGKPQRELPSPHAVEASEPEIAPPPPRPYVREALPVNFRNRPAVQIALLVAASSTVAFFIMPFLNWIIGGFFAVFFYRRRTGLLVNTGSGMRLGWITGVLAFALYMIPFAMQLPRMNAMLQERLRTLPTDDPAMLQEMMRFFQSSAGMATAVGFSLMAMFVIITLLSIAGGALAGKFTGRSS